MFFSSVRVRSSSEPGRADGDVDVEAHRALLELGVGEAELDDRLAQQLQEALGVSASWMSGAVTISTSGVPPRLKSTSVAVAPWMRPRRGDVDVLRRVLLEVRAR